MNSKAIAVTVTFAAITTGLNIVRIPTVFWPGAWYPITEIPLVIAFLLFGFKIALFVGVVNLVSQLTIFLPGPAYLVGYPFGFLALLVTLFAISLGSKFIAHKNASRPSVKGRTDMFYLTAFATAFRVAIMPLVDVWINYRVLLPLVLGISISDSIALGFLPAFILMNLIVPVYTVPVAYVVASNVGWNLKINPRFLRQV